MISATVHFIRCFDKILKAIDEINFVSKCWDRAQIVSNLYLYIYIDIPTYSEEMAPFGRTFMSRIFKQFKDICKPISLKM